MGQPADGLAARYLDHGGQDVKRREPRRRALRSEPGRRDMLSRASPRADPREDSSKGNLVRVARSAARTQPGGRPTAENVCLGLGSGIKMGFQQHPCENLR